MGEVISLRVRNRLAAMPPGRGTDWDTSSSWPHPAAATRRPRREASDPRARHEERGTACRRRPPSERASGRV